MTAPPLRAEKKLPGRTGWDNGSTLIRCGDIEFCSFYYTSFALLVIYVLF